MREVSAASKISDFTVHVSTLGLPGPQPEILTLTLVQVRLWAFLEAGAALEVSTVLPLKVKGAYQAWVDTGLGRLGFSGGLRLLWSGLTLSAERAEELV